MRGLRSLALQDGYLSFSSSSFSQLHLCEPRLCPFGAKAHRSPLMKLQLRHLSWVGFHSID